MSKTNESRVSPGVAVLWASAFIIMAMIITQAGRVTNPDGGAMAGVVSRVGDYTAMTVATGNQDDVLVILDSRAENVYTYLVKNRALELQEVRSVPDMFEIAANRGRPRR